jgi:hypothetical protein
MKQDTSRLTLCINVWAVAGVSYTFKREFFDVLQFSCFLCRFVVFLPKYSVCLLFIDEFTVFDLQLLRAVFELALKRVSAN